MQTIARSTFIACAAVGLSLLLPACNSARVQDSWKDPAVNKITYTRLFVAVSAPSDTTRRAAETSMQQSIQLPVVTATQSGLPADADVAGLKKAVAAANCDGVALVRVVSSKEELGYIPGAPVPVAYGTMRGYWGLRAPYGSPAVAMSAPTPTVDHVVIIEVALYDVKTEKLQWTGTLESINPGSAAELGGEVAQAVAAKLRSQGLIP